MASQALLKALTAGRPKQTRLLLQLGADVNCQDELGQTPLIRSLQIQDPRLRASFLRILLQAGAHVGRSDASKRNALMWACRVATCDDVMLLLQATGVDFDINARDNRGQTALWAAADAGQADVVRVLVELLLRGHQPLDVGDHQGVTPAMRAAIRGHVDCLNLIIKQDDPFRTESVDFQALSNRRNVIQLAEVISQNNQSNKLQEEETSPSSSRSVKSGAVPIIRIISANGQHVLTLPQTLEPSDRLLHPDDADRHRPDAVDVRKHSEGLEIIRGHSATRAWCSTPSLSTHRQNTSPSLHLDVSGISAVATPTPGTPDERFSRLSRRSAQPRRALSCRAQSRRTPSRRPRKSQEDCVIYRERTWAPENDREVWTDLTTFDPLAHAATGTVNSTGGSVHKGVRIRIHDGRCNIPDMRQAGIFTSTPDPLPLPGTREADVRVLPWPWPCDSSVRESLPHLFSMFAPFYSQSFRKAAVRLPNAPSLSKTLRIIHHAQEKAEEKAREQAERERLENAAVEEENNPARRGSSWSRLRGAVNKMTPGVKPTSPAARAARQELNHFA